MSSMESVTTRPLTDEELAILRSNDFCICVYAVCKGPIWPVVTSCAKHMELRAAGAPEISAECNGPKVKP